LGEYEVSGAALGGLKLEAQLSFPGQIKTLFSNWRYGGTDSIPGHDVDVVQGRGANGLLATFYFDRKTGFLVREVRYTPSPVGRVATQSDFDDYREVGGIKFPFKYTYSWLDGRDAFQLREVRVNVPIEESKFGRP
jgi:hypothetical protein